MSIKNNILKVFSANIISMITGLVVSFIIPYVLSIESYANLKTYTFYVSYITFFSLGFVDGIYLKYGGKNKESIDLRELKEEHLFYIVIQVLFMIAFFIVGVFLNDYIIITMSLTIIPLNVSGFHKLFNQSIGDFNNYTKASYIYTINYFVLNLFLLLVFKTSNYKWYCLTTLVANLIVFLIFEYKFFKETKKIKVSFNLEHIKNIKNGFFVLIGNLSVVFFYAIDRWFVKAFFTIDDFAYYSFAVSMLNVINLLVSSISVTLYNYLAKGEDKEKIQRLKRYLLILGGASSFGYFAFAGVVNIFLIKYIPALSIIAISFVAYPYMIVINVLYVNLYKVRKNQIKYLKVVILMVIISTIYNGLAIILWKNTGAIAIATTLSFITWYAYSLKDFEYLKPDCKEITYLVCLILVFIITSNIENWIYGAVLYLIIYIVMIFILYKNEANDVKNIIINK